MAKPKTSDSSPTDRHKPSKLIRISKKLADILDVLADRNASSAPIEANRAVREMLEREGFWPPKK